MLKSKNNHKSKHKPPCFECYFHEITPLHVVPAPQKSKYLDSKDSWAKS